MIKNYLKIALRNLTKRKGFTFINVTGLAVGMACCLLIALYVRHELSYDRFHAHADRIYRVVTEIRTGGETHRLAISQAPLGPALQTEDPDVLAYARLVDDALVFRQGDRRFHEKDLFYADPSLFQIFSFSLVRGDTATALDAPFSVVLTQETARKYFGAEDPIGRTLATDREHTFTVTGVLDDVPSASHLTFDLLVSMSTREALAPGRLEGWFDEWVFTYVLVREGTDPAALAARLPAFVERHLGRVTTALGIEVEPSFQPLPDLYLHSDRLGEPGPTGNPATLYVFACVAAFILIIACVNFMNLSTARSAERAREVGVRKVVGAARRGLVVQFLMESVLLALGSMALALLMAELAMPAFRALSGKTIEGGVLTDPAMVAAFAGVALAVGLLAGAYPAFVLSRFQPVAVLKGRFRTSRQGVLLRKGLVVFQFAISVALIAGTAVVYTQLYYVQHRDLGFAQAQKVVLNLGGEGMPRARVETIRQELLKLPQVRGATASTSVPGVGYAIMVMQMEYPDHEMRQSSLNFFRVDYDFADEYGLEVIAGRGFSPGFPADTAGAMIVNEATVAHLGYTSPEEILGRRVHQEEREGTIVGVMKDFHYMPLHQRIEPFALRLHAPAYNHLTLRLETRDFTAALAGLEEAWQRLVPNVAFDYVFLDQTFAEEYEADRRFGLIFSVFAGLAIFIACLGLFGLVSFAIQQRTKEIGVRKVMGATVPELAALLSKDFLLLVGIGFAVALPVAAYGMHRWLDRFAYRIDLPWWTFPAAGLAALLVALLTVSYQALRAARANPVDALRYE